MRRPSHGSFDGCLPGDLPELAVETPQACLKDRIGVCRSTHLYAELAGLHVDDMALVTYRNLYLTTWCHRHRTQAENRPDH